MKKYIVNGEAIYKVMHHLNKDSIRELALAVDVGRQTLCNYAHSTKEAPRFAKEETLLKLCNASGWPLCTFILSSIIEEPQASALDGTQWQLACTWNETVTHLGRFTQNNGQLHFASPSTNLYLSGSIVTDRPSFAHGRLMTRPNGSTLIRLASFLVEFKHDTLQGAAVASTIDGKIVSVEVEGKMVSSDKE